MLSYPLMAAIQEISARIGRVTGIRHRRQPAPALPAWLSGSVVTLLLVANLINLGADLGAMGAAVKLLIHGPALLYVVLFGVLSTGLQVFTRYATYVSFSSICCLALLAYVICAFMVNVAWADVGWAIVWPPFSSERRLPDGHCRGARHHDQPLSVLLAGRAGSRGREDAHRRPAADPRARTGAGANSPASASTPISAWRFPTSSPCSS